MPTPHWIDQKGRRNTLDNTLEPADKDAIQVYLDIKSAWLNLDIFLSKEKKNH